MDRLRTYLLATSALIPLGLVPAVANPLGAQVVGGSAAVQGQGTSTVTVTQQSNSAIVNWNTFNISAGEKTKILMPNASSVQLDRVNGGLGPSQILGSLWSNGRVFLVNPDGIMFSAGATVNTASFLATTHDIANADFMAGKYNFSMPGNPTASVVNLGTITASNTGFAALVAPGVRNSGTITARLGTVGLASSGTGFSLDFYGDKLITLNVNDQIAATVKDVATGQPLNSLVSNDGKLKANGGRVELTAAAARQVVDSVISNSGVIEANTIGARNGMIVLGAATAATLPAGAPTQTVKVSGTLSAAGKKKGAKGGTIQVTGENIVLAGATIDASGRNGGGKVLIGGAVGGGNPSPLVASITQAKLEAQAVPTATTVSIDGSTTINASATGSGDGGKVVVWSDQATAFLGTILARGGSLAGNGGFVETSGHQQLAFNGTVDLSAPQGTKGTLLLDPQDVTIASAGTWIVTPAALQTALASGDVIVSTGNGSGNGDITVAESFTWTNASALTLSAYRNITINASITNTGAAPITLRADNTGTGVGTVSFGGGALVSTAGTVSIFYNSADNPAGSIVNTTSYTNPTDYTPYVLTNGSVPNQLTAYMLVNTVYDLQNIENNLSGAYALGTNIDASTTASTGFVPIGGDANRFTGIFEGNAHKIDSLNITRCNFNTDCGLFGDIGAQGVVRNLGITNVTLSGATNMVGGLAGTNYGTIFNSYVTGSIISACNCFVGGLVGFNVGGSITQSYSSADVTGGEVTGGLVGYNVNGSIAKSYATGLVINNFLDNGSGGSAGGLAGYNQYGTITDSYATGSVRILSGGTPWYNGVGGLVGVNFSATITDSYSTGSITGGAGYAGGLAGFNYVCCGLPNGSATNSYWDVQASGQTTSALGAGLTTAQLKSGLPSGFDPAVWGISATINNGYPYLLWQVAGSSPTSPTILTGGPTPPAPPPIPTPTPQPAPPSTSSSPAGGGSNQAACAVCAVQNLGQYFTPIANWFGGLFNPASNLQAIDGQNIYVPPYSPLPNFQTISGQNVYVQNYTATPNYVAPALQGTQNQNGDSPQWVTPTLAPGGIYITTWGYSDACGCILSNAASTPYLPIDTMTLNIDGHVKTLNAYANVDNDGTKNPDGPFQCTTLVAQYLSLLGFPAPSAGNGQAVATNLATSYPALFDSSSSDAPKIGSIISMYDQAPGIGHVAIVKGVTSVDSNTIIVTLIEDNMTIVNQNTFAVNRQMTFTKSADGTWSSTYQMQPGGSTYEVKNWVTPTGLP